MRHILIFSMGLLSTVIIHGKTIVSGCVIDANGTPVGKAKVFAAPRRGDKTYKAETHKSDGCYEMHIAKDGIYSIGLRDPRFGSDGPVQSTITVTGLDLPNVNLSTNVPNEKLVRDTVMVAVMSASSGFARLRKGISHDDVPVIEAESPSGFDSCLLQSSSGPQGPTTMWYCVTGGGFAGIRRPEDAHAMFEKIRGSTATALASVGRLHYSAMTLDYHRCPCVDRAVWASPINGVIVLTQTQVNKRNGLTLWAAYSTSLTERGCAALQRSEEPNVDFARYDSAVTAMLDEHDRQVKAAYKAALRNLFGAAIGGPGFIGSTQQAGLTGESTVSPNTCLTKQ